MDAAITLLAVLLDLIAVLAVAGLALLAVRAISSGVFAGSEPTEGEDAPIAESQTSPFEPA